MLFKKDRQSVGLEIGDGLVKAMYIQSSAKKNKLLGFEVAEVNFREGRDGIIKAIKEVLGKLAINPKKNKINISVSGESVVVRDIHWPQMSPDEIKKALKFEVERQIHYKMEEVVFDYYSILDKTMAETKTRVVLIAAKIDLIENYASLVTESGYHCGFVEVDTFSLLNCFYLNGPAVKAEKTIAIINVGEEVTNIDIIKGKIVGLTKDAFVAWNNLLDALPENFQLDFCNIVDLKGMLGSDDIYELCSFIMNALSNQIRRTIEFFEDQGEDRVEEIFLCGKVAMFKNLDKYLGEVLELKVSLWDPTSNIKFDPKLSNQNKLRESSLMLALCTGLAAHRCFNINLLSPALADKKTASYKNLFKYKSFYLAPVGMICFLILTWMIMSYQIRVKESRKERLQKENQKQVLAIEVFDNLKDDLKKDELYLSIVKTLFTRRIYWGEKLYQISKSLPQDVWLTELSVRNVAGGELEQKEEFEVLSDYAAEAFMRLMKKQSLLIKGISCPRENDKMLLMINNFVNNLKRNLDFVKNFNRIALLGSYRQKIGDSEVMRFEIECFLR